MWFRPDPEGEAIGKEANRVVADFCLSESIKAHDRLHICGDSCPGCGNEVENADDRLDWWDKVKRWSLAIATRPRAEYDADSYPVKKHNRRSKKK